MKECQERTDTRMYISKEMEKFPMPQDKKWGHCKYMKRKIRILELILDKIYFTDTRNKPQLERIYKEEQELMNWKPKNKITPKTTKGNKK
jgi:hypothetical protein